MKKFICLFFFFFLFSSCVGSSSISSSNVKVNPVAFHSDSIARTASGRPYIRLKGARQICRWRPFTLRDLRLRLKNDVGLSEDAMNKYFFPETEGESEESESNTRAESQPVYYNAENNWTKFGLVIQNETNFTLVIDTIRYQARAKCGNEIFEHSGEFDSSYCASEGGATPFLYIVPPSRVGQVNYIPQSSSPFDNLTLIIDGFPIKDRTEFASKNLQNTFSSSTQNNFGSAGNTENNNLDQQNRECQPNEIIVKPRYTIELTLIGYFIVTRRPPDREGVNREPGDDGEEVNYFVKRVSFQTTNF